MAVFNLSELQLLSILELAGITKTKSRRERLNKLNLQQTPQEREQYLQSLLSEFFPQGLNAEDQEKFQSSLTERQLIIEQNHGTVINDLPQQTEENMSEEKEPEFAFEQDAFEQAVRASFGNATLSEDDLKLLRSHYIAHNGSLEDFNKDQINPSSSQAATIHEDGENDGEHPNEPTQEGEENSDPAGLAELAEFYSQWCQTDTFADGEKQGQPKRNYEQIATEDGTLHFVIKPDPSLGETGTEIMFTNPKEMTVMAYNGVKPGDRSYIYFVKDCQAMMKTGSTALEFGATKTPQFVTKFWAATIETGMTLSKLPQTISLAPEVTEGMSDEVKGKLLFKALQNGIKIENAPQVLDFSQQAIKDLPPQEQYKILGAALVNGMKIENGPAKIEMYKRDADGKFIFDKVEAVATGKKFNTSRFQESPLMAGLSEEEKAAIKKYSMEQLRAKAEAVNNPHLFRSGKDKDERNKIKEEREQVMKDNLTPEQYDHRIESLRKQFAKVKTYGDQKKDPNATTEQKNRAQQGLDNIFRKRWEKSK